MTKKSPTPNNDSNQTQADNTLNNKLNKKVLYSIVLALMLIVGVLLGFVIGKDGFGEKPAEGANQANSHKPTDASTSDSNDISASQATANSQPESPVLTVEVIRPQLAKVSTNLSADGTVTAKDTASISSKINGLAIENVLVEEGQWVNKGDLLATFDTKTLQQNAIQAEAGIMQAEGNVRQAEASVSQADVNLAKAQVDLERVLPLLRIGAVSQQNVDTYSVQVKQAQAGLVSAQASLTSAEARVISANAQFNNQKINFQDSKLLAPVSGIISQKKAQIGAIPQGSLFTIIEDGRLEWQAELNPKDVSKIKVGMPVAVRDTDNQLIKGKVSRINPVANASRQISVYVALSSKQGVQSGMLLTGEFIIGSDPQIILPVSAITSSDGYDYIMAVGEIKEGKDEKGNLETTGRIQRIKVELGRQENNAVIIKTQLPANTAVVGQGGSFLSEGDLVRVVGK